VKCVIIYSGWIWNLVKQVQESISPLHKEQICSITHIKPSEAFVIEKGDFSNGRNALVLFVNVRSVCLSLRGESLEAISFGVSLEIWVLQWGWSKDPFGSTGSRKSPAPTRIIIISVTLCVQFDLTRWTRQWQHISVFSCDSDTVFPIVRRGWSLAICG